MDIDLYTGTQENLYNNTRYQVTLPPRASPAGQASGRSFTGIHYEFNWSHEKQPCIYAGNRQGGPIHEVKDPNDPVIEGHYKEYQVSGPFSEAGYKYSLFNSTVCS